MNDESENESVRFGIIGIFDSMSLRVSREVLAVLCCFGLVAIGGCGRQNLTLSRLNEIGQALLTAHSIIIDGSSKTLNISQPVVVRTNDAAISQAEGGAVLVCKTSVLAEQIRLLYRVAASVAMLVPKTNRHAVELRQSDVVVVPLDEEGRVLSSDTADIEFIQFDRLEESALPAKPEETVAPN